MSKRTREQLYEHYQIEKELASRLRSSSRVERVKLYSSVYDELYERIPDHPQLMTRTDQAKRTFIVNLQMELLSKFLNPEQAFLEIGCGNCCLSFEIAKFVRKVYGVDVSRKISHGVDVPDNFKLIISDGITIDVPAESIDIAYSHQLLEHLHPDDIQEHLREVYRVLVSGGMYICITPHRFMGPHDISGYFEKEAKGFHLHEYTNKELCSLLKNSGFIYVRSCIRVRGHYARVSPFPTICVENMMESLPYKIRKTLSRTILKNILAIRLIAEK